MLPSHGEHAIYTFSSHSLKMINGYYITSSLTEHVTATTNRQTYSMTRLRYFFLVRPFFIFHRLKRDFELNISIS